MKNMDVILQPIIQWTVTGGWYFKSSKSLMIHKKENNLLCTIIVMAVVGFRGIYISIVLYINQHYGDKYFSL
jgi:hypothetical protein